MLLSTGKVIRMTNSTTTNENGVATLTGVSEGDLEIIISKEGFETLTDTLNVSRESISFTKQLVATYQVTFTLMPSVNALLSIYDMNSGESPQAVISKASFTVDEFSQMTYVTNLPAGTYAVICVPSDISKYKSYDSYEEGTNLEIVDEDVDYDILLQINQDINLLG